MTDQYSQQHLKVAATEDEHLVRKIELDRKIAIGVEIERLPGDRSTVRLLDANGKPSGKIVRNIILLPSRKTQSMSTSAGDHHATWDTLTADEMIDRAAKHNPVTEVEIV